MGRQRRWTLATGRKIFVALPLIYLSQGAWALDATIKGVADEVESNIQAYLENIDAAQYTEVRLEGEIRRRTEEAMRVYGYYEPEITLERATDEQVWLEIEPGPQVEIEVLSINVEG
ncbi:MAG TPA: POTRA domain-containing protein, partial [Halomonas sp.]|nr:POTRA domain-containing protein [Halomonas sp.]